MDTSNFEAVKVAIKQDKSGYILTLSIHPDEIPDEIMRDFVGSRYQVVMVRLGEDERPVVRDEIVKLAGMLCRDKQFAAFLIDRGLIFEDGEETIIGWLKDELGIQSRTELKTNKEAAAKLKNINLEFQQWKRNG